MQCPKCNTKITKGSTVCFTCGYNLKTGKTDQKNEKISKVSHFNVMKKNRVAAVLILILPYAFLIFVIISYALVASFRALLPAESSGILQTILGMLGVVSVVGIIIGAPIAVFVGSRKKEPVAEFDPRSGMGEQSTFPPELKKWNWGAVGLPIIWGMYHGVWVSFITLIPYVNWVWWIIMGLEGNKWAWEKRYWKNIEEFKAAQKKWQVWGIIFFFLPGILIVLGLVVGIISSL